MCTIDDIIEFLAKNRDENSIKGAILLDYYLFTYEKKAESRFINMENISLRKKLIGKKATSNFFLVCLNSVQENNYGLFNIFNKFGIICGYNQTIINATCKLKYDLPTFYTKDSFWYQKDKDKLPFLWMRFKELSIPELIHSSSLAKYAKMIDDGVDFIFDRFPVGNIVEIESKLYPCSLAKDLAFTGHTNIVKHLYKASNRHNFSILSNLTAEELYKDKCLMLKEMPVYS